MARHRIGDSITLGDKDTGGLALTLRSVHLHVEQTVPFDAGPGGRTGLHAVRMGFASRDGPYAGLVDYAVVWTSAQRWVEVDPLVDLATPTTEAIEGALVFFLRDGEVPVVLRCVDEFGRCAEWDLVD